MAAFKEEIEARLNSIERLPALSPAVLAVQPLFQDASAGPADVAKVIESDPGLAGAILRLANSAYHGQRAGRIASVTQAVIRLGFQETARVVRDAGTMAAFHSLGKHLDHHDFWRHSLLAAMAARILAPHAAQPERLCVDEAYTAGLLHDVGLLALEEYFPIQMNHVHHLTSLHGAPQPDIEMEVLGMDHGAAGAILLRQWNLPEHLAQAIQWHHHPSSAPENARDFVSLIHLADFMSLGMGMGLAIEDHSLKCSELTWNRLGISTDDFPLLVSQLEKEAGQCVLFVAASQGNETPSHIPSKS